VSTAHADVTGGMCARACPHICPVAVGRAAQGRGQGRCVHVLYTKGTKKGACARMFGSPAT
jgi:hypothetical protein